MTIFRLIHCSWSPCPYINWKINPLASLCHCSPFLFNILLAKHFKYIATIKPINNKILKWRNQGPIHLVNKIWASIGLWSTNPSTWMKLNLKYSLITLDGSHFYRKLKKNIKIKVLCCWGCGENVQTCILIIIL